MHYFQQRRWLWGEIDAVVISLTTALLFGNGQFSFIKTPLPQQICSFFDKGVIIMKLSVIVKKGLIACPVMLFLSGWTDPSVLCAGEHPEHPRGGYNVEEQKPRITKEDVAKFAEQYIRKNSQDGVFKYHDKNTGKELELTLDRVHRDNLSLTKRDEYFVCADFKGKDNNTYDLDFFVQGTDKGNLRIDKTSIAVHKVNGKENYSWEFNKKKDLWEKKSIIIEKEYPKKGEHPGFP